MAREKKDGVHVNLYLDRTVMEKLRKYADIKGQTLTTAIERILAERLAQEEEVQEKEQDDVRH